MPTIQEIMQTANDAGASDVHITVGIPPKMRVNGNLIAMDYPKMMPQDTLSVAYSSTNDVQRERFDERGEYDMSFSIPELGRYRVNVYKQRGSAALALRLVGTQVPAPEKLGVPMSVINLYERKRGLILVTGPTGSGKSTTLAAIIDKINNNRDAHVITLEDPIEYLHQHKCAMVNQREIGLDSQSYANALRAALREDPDVILVGEFRDLAPSAAPDQSTACKRSGGRDFPAAYPHNGWRGQSGGVRGDARQPRGQKSDSRRKVPSACVRHADQP